MRLLIFGLPLTALVSTAILLVSGNKQVKLATSVITSLSALSALLLFLYLHVCVSGVSFNELYLLGFKRFGIPVLTASFFIALGIVSFALVKKGKWDDKEDGE